MARGNIICILVQDVLTLLVLEEVERFLQRIDTPSIQMQDCLPIVRPEISATPDTVGINCSDCKLALYSPFLNRVADAYKDAHSLFIKNIADLFNNIAVQASRAETIR